MTIREITEQDNPVIAAIIKSVMAEFDADPVTTILGDPVLDRMYSDYLSLKSVYYLIIDNNIIAGGCGINQLKNTTDNICELQRMFLLPAFRGKGYGKLLIDLCIEKAGEFGYEQIYLETLSQMKTAIGLYKSRGFEILKYPIGNTGHSGCNVFMSLELKNK